MVVSSYDLMDRGWRFASSSASMILDPLVICGPSGVGKGTLIARFQVDFPELANQFGFTVSHTTRAPRPGEVNGVHYHFVSMDEMKKMLSEGAFLESAQVHQNYYGTSWQSLQDVQTTGKRALLDIDVQGVQHLKLMQIAHDTAADGKPLSWILEPVYLFIAPPSIQTLHDRLVARNTETAEALQTRLANAEAEVAYGMEAGNFHAIVVNDDLDKAAEDFGNAVRQLYEL